MAKSALSKTKPRRFGVPNAAAAWGWRSEAGFSLVETIVATGLLAGAVAALGQMFAISVADNTSARTGTFAAVLAEQKMEQLRGLTWGFDILGLPLSDMSTDLAQPVQAPDGGRGLQPSPTDSLRRNVDGYVDYLDQFGRIIGGGSTVPDRAVYIRRWSVEPLPTNPNNTLVLQVLVTSVARDAARDTSQPRRRMPGDAWLVSVKTRKAS